MSRHRFRLPNNEAARAVAREIARLIESVNGHLVEEDEGSPIVDWLRESPVRPENAPIKGSDLVLRTTSKARSSTRRSR